MVVPGAVNAQDDTGKARKHFEKGKNLYDAGDFAPALVEFKEAFRLRDDVAFLFNMGQCHSKLGDDSAALHAYKSFLRRKPEATNRTPVEARIAEIEKRQQQAVVEPLAPPPNSSPPETKHWSTKRFESVAKSRICVASLRCSSVRYVEYLPSSRLGLLASPQFCSVFKPFGALDRGDHAVTSP